MINKNFRLLESFGLKNGNFIAYNAHLNRLTKSAAYFDFKLHINKIHDYLSYVKEKNPTGYFKIRLLVGHSGEIEWNIAEISPITGILQVALTNTPIDHSDIFLYHKTTKRKVYENAKKDYPNLFDVLLWNEDEELTEFTIGNLVCEINGELYTPPVESGLLAGTYREELLSKGEIQIKKVYKRDLIQTSKIWLINSVREWVNVELKSK